MVDVEVADCVEEVLRRGASGFFFSFLISFARGGVRQSGHDVWAPSGSKG